MKLHERWLEFTSGLMDKMMHHIMQDSKVSLAEWEEAKSNYKAIYGKEYKPPHATQYNCK